MTAHTERPVLDDPLHVLLIEGNPGDAQLFEEHLRDSPQEFHLQWEEDLETGLQRLDQATPDVVVIDLGLPDSASPETVEAVTASAPAVPIVVLTGQKTLETALRAQEAGAAEYLQKDELTPALVGRTLQWAVRQGHLEAELRQRDAWLRSLTEGVSAGMFRAGPTGRIEHANEALLQMLGVEREEELIGRDLTTLAADPPQQGQMLAEEGGDGTEITLRRTDGSVLVGLLTAQAAYDADGEVLHYDGVITDITERRQREQELAEREARYRAIAESAQDAIITMDADSTIQFANPAVEDIFGYAPDELIGEPVTMLMPERHRQDHLRALDRFLETEELYDMAEEDLLGKNFWEVFDEALDTRFEDTYRRVMETREPDSLVEHFPRLSGWFDVQVYPNEDGGLAFYFDEITEQKRRERALRDREQKTEALYTATEQLVSAQTRQEVAERIQTLVSEIFDYPLNGVHFVEEGRLVPAAISPSVPDRVPEVPAPSLDESNLAARAYRSGETVVAEDFSEVESEIDFGELRSGAFVPLSDHCVLLVGSVQANGIDDFDVRLLELLGAHAATVLDRIEREDTLREERDLLNRILETSPVAIAVFNPEGEFVQASGRAEDVLGLEKEEVTDRTYDDPDWGITAPDGSPMPDEELPFARVMATGEPVHDVEHAIEWPDGQWRLLSVSGAPLRGPDDEIEGAVFHIDDITERRQAERKLRESERRFRKLFTEAPIGIARVDLDGRIIETNAAFRDTLGYDAETLRGQHFRSFTYEDDIGVAEEEFDALVRGEGSSYTIEKRYRRGDGTVFWARLTASFLNHEGETQVIAMVQDIDDQKRYEENLRAAKEEAERMNRLKSAFLTNMSHEIRTPLTSIIGFAEMIDEQVADDAEGTIPRYARLIGKSGHRLLHTLDGVLNLSKLEAGEMDLSTNVLNLAAEAEDTAQQFEPQARDADVDLRVNTGGAPALCRADPEGMRMGLRNLLSNAIKYTDAGGTVWVRTRTEDETVVLEVEDTGIGMDPEKTDQLFEAFAQESEGIGREYEGTGLGLTVTRRAVEEMGGSIEVETQKGEGSCFAVRLPRAEGKT